MDCSRSIKRWIFGGALFMWMGCIFALSSLQGMGTAYEPPLWYVLERKGAHVFEYAVLMLLSMFFLNQFDRIRKNNRALVIVAGLFSFLYAVSDEIHQLFVFGRSGRIFDVGVDLLGIIVGAFLFFRFFQKK